LVFSGKAVYSPNVWASDLAEDVAPTVSIISTYETPMLDALGDAQYPAAQAYHEWPEDALAPNTFVSSTALASVTTDSVLGFLAGVAAYLRVGAILRLPGDVAGRVDDGEYFQVKTITGPDTMTVTRAFGGTSASSTGAGLTFEVISDAALEGDDVTTDVSRPRDRKFNYCQIVKKDVIVSGSLEAQKRVGGITSEIDYQEQMRLREALRDLEKLAIKGILSGNSIGSASAYRSMNGILRMLSTNVVSVAASGGFTEDGLNAAIKLPWDAGARDVDLIVVDAIFKRQIDLLNASRVRRQRRWDCSEHHDDVRVGVRYSAGASQPVAASSHRADSRDWSTEGAAAGWPYVQCAADRAYR